MNRYCLKPMVLARLFAESTVFIAFISAPMVLLASGQMHQLALPIQVLSYCLAGVGLAVLPWFGFLTWRVRVDEHGLTADALFTHQFCAWKSMKKITRRSNFNWQRYVIEFEEGSLHFPILLLKSDELVRIIRDHLPADKAGEANPSQENPRRIFKYDPVAMFLQIVQAVVACIFALMFWFFFTFNLNKHFHSEQDAAMILIFCLAFTVIFVWRLFVVLMMPTRVELRQDGLFLNNAFSSKELSWLEVLALTSPLPLLPEGFIIKTKQGNFLIGTGMDAADELQEVMIKEMDTARQDRTSIAAAVQDKSSTEQQP